MEMLMKAQATSRARADKVSASYVAEQVKLMPWVEKYRPKTIQDVASQTEVVEVLKKCLQSGNIPHLLFYGPPGTGKTSTILAVARELYGSDMFRERVKELNASDDRGIKVVREKIKQFAQISVNSRRADGGKCPPFKIIILDEADNMTVDAQSALRRLMEKESKSTRFCILCNYVSRIIDPITSRCAKFRFKPVPDAILEEHLNNICDKEDVAIEPSAIKLLIKVCGGDMRRAINTMQSMSKMKCVLSTRETQELTGEIPEHIIQPLVNILSSNSYEKIEIAVKGLILEGYSAYQFLCQIHPIVLEMDQLQDKRKSIILEKIALCDKRLMDGADEFLQLMDLCSTIMKQLCQA